MKAALTLSVLFAAVLGLAATLYIVMKNSVEYRHETAVEMERLWSKEAPQEVGPFVEQGVEWWVVLPPADSGWKFEIQGEKIVIQLKSLDFRSAPEAPAPPTAELAEKLWQASLPQLREKVAKLLKMDGKADLIELVRPDRPL